jgi:hypothetical protein
VPQFEQNWRNAMSEESKRAGLPLVKTNAADRKVAQDTKAAPLARRQISQWQWVSLVGLPVVR